MKSMSVYGIWRIGIGCRWGILAFTVLICPLIATARTVGIHTNYPFARYNVILERMPFGKPPPPEAQPAPSRPDTSAADKLEEEFLSQHRLCAITRTPRGVGIGFIETSERQPRTFFLMVDEEIAGYRVVAADFHEETVELEKDGVKFRLSMSDTALPGERAETETAARTRPSPQQRRGRQPAARRPDTAGEDNGEPERLSYVERLRQRREAERQRRIEAAQRQRIEVEEEVVERLTGEALRQHLREHNLDLIRARGALGPPLPLELTPEEDEQLVSEGILPPEP